jgi:pPIWI RE three-gene island domain Z
VQSNVGWSAPGGIFSYTIKNARQWRAALERYREVDERLRLFDVDEQLDRFTRRAPSVCADREEFYSEVIRRPLPYAKRNIQWAKADQTYLCFDRRKRRAVTIPADFPLPPPPEGHTLRERACHPSLFIPWSELLDTARWMDEESERRGLPPRNWSAHHAGRR